MKKNNRHIPGILLLTLSACSTPSSTQPISVPAVEATAASPTQDTTQVKKWLTTVIENYTNSNEPKAAFDSLRQSLTDDYYEYKQDAINMEYDSGEPPLSKAGFQQKWQGKYNTKLVGTGGFIISSQDNGQVKVTDCRLLQQPAEGVGIYKVTIKDLDLGAVFNRDIKVVSRDGRFLIDDIVGT